MGDSENSLPASKKRAAGRELSRDNPGLEDEEDVCEQQSGTCKKASEEVMANRRIVKVRRQQTPSAAPSSNPFAGISLVPPTNSSTQDKVTTAEETLKTDPEKAEEKTNYNDEIKKGKVEPEKQEESKISEGGSAVETEGDVIKESAKPETNETGDDSKENCEEKKTENGDENLKKSDESGAFSSFQQLSSTQNAFTGFTGTGFSFGSSLGSYSGSDFGLKTDQPFPTIEKREIPIGTGEENEKSVFMCDATLFEFFNGGWKEKGKGEIKVNVPTSGTGKGRLVMRSKGNYRLILNAKLYSDIKLTNMERRGITFACLNSATDGKDGLSTFALKFKSSSIVDEFRTAVTDHKDDTASVSLKTPENSPRAPDE